MKKGLLYRAIVIILVCTMLLGLTGFSFINPLSDDGNVQGQENPIPAVDPVGGDDSDNQGDEKDTVKVTIAPTDGGSVTCADLPEGGEVAVGTELKFTAKAATEDVVSSELVGVKVNGKAVEVGEDGSFTVVANDDITVSAEFFGLKSVAVENSDIWTQSKTVTVETIGPAAAHLEDTDGKKVDFTIKGNIGETGEKYTVVVACTDKTDVESVKSAVTVKMIDNENPEIIVGRTDDGKNQHKVYTWTITASDSGSGIDKDSLKITRKYGGNEIDVTKLIKVSWDGDKCTFDTKDNFNYGFCVKDNAGNSSSNDPNDTTAPAVEVEKITAGPGSKDGTYYVAADGKITIVFSDQTGVDSAVLVTENGDKIDGNNVEQPDLEENESAFSFTVKKSGEYKIIATDSNRVATATNEAKTITIKYDPDAPVITNVKFEPREYVANGSNSGVDWLKGIANYITGGLLFNNGFKITFDINDNPAEPAEGTEISGPYKYAWKLVEEGKEAPTAPAISGDEGWVYCAPNPKNPQEAVVEVLGEFDGYIYACVWDKAGNNSTVTRFEQDADGKLVSKVVNLATSNDNKDEPNLTVMATSTSKTDKNGVIITDENGNAVVNAYYVPDGAKNASNKEAWAKSVDFDISYYFDKSKNELPKTQTTENNDGTTTTITYAYGEPVLTLVAGDTQKTVSLTPSNAADGIYTGKYTIDWNYFGDVTFTVSCPINRYVGDGDNVVLDESYKNNFTSESVSVYVKVQSTIKAASIAVNGTIADKVDLSKWFNGCSNILSACIVTAPESDAPFTTTYTLSYKPVNADENADSDPVVGAIEISGNSLDIKNSLTASGVYTLTAVTEDILGNKPDAEPSITIYYDPIPATIYAVFDQEKEYNSTTDNEYFDILRTATVTITDDTFTGNEDTSKFVTITKTLGADANLGEWKFVTAEDKVGGKWINESISYGVKSGAAKDGDHYQMTINVTDNAGNTSSTNEKGIYTNSSNVDDSSNHYSGHKPNDFTIDQTKPIVSVSFDKNNALNGKYFPSGRTATITVKEHNFDANRVKMTADNATSGGNGTTGWNQSSNNPDVWTKTVVFNPQDATCKFSIEVTDLAGNVCREADVNYGNSVAHNEFVVDQVNPTLNITGTNATPYADDCTPGFSGHDTNMSNEYTMTLTRTVRASRNENVSDKFLSRGSVSVTGTDINAVFNTLTKEAENDGIYILDVTITDMAGNSSHATSTFTVNRNGSFYVFNEALSKVVNAKFVQKADGKYQVTEYNASPLVSGSVKIEIYRDGQLVKTLTPSVGEGGIGASGLYEYTYDLPAKYFEQDGRYKIAITSEDEAQNKSDSTKLDDAMMEFVVDSVKPEIIMIKGLENKIVNAESLDVSANAIDTYGIASIKVVVDGKVVKEYVTQEAYDKLLESGKKLDHEYAVLTDMLDFTAEYTLLESSDNQTVEFIVTDMAGNSTTTNAKDFAPVYDFHDTVLVSTSFFARYIHNVWAILATVVVLAGAGAAWYFLFGKKKKEEEEAAA